MDSQTLADLSRHFDTKLNSVMSCLEMRAAIADPNCEQSIEDLNKDMQDLEHILGIMKVSITKEKKQLSSIEKIKQEFVSLLTRLEHTINNIPQRLPNTQDAGNNTEKKSADGNQTSVPSNMSNSNSANSDVAQNRVVTEKVICPVIEYLRVDEFEDVPKYMKGRHTYNKVNSLVDSLNNSLKAKYKVLQMKKSALNDLNRKRVDEYKLQENKDTKGVFFVVEKDLKESAGVKLDATNRAILTILRHTSRIHEIRGGGMTRYAVLEQY